jgi:Na+-transporting methylmalonyl-CoA/oxaloacetate decarboxylase gamma subunit
MLAVFAFLIILVLAMALLQRVVERLGSAAAAPSQDDTATVAAAAAAVHAYRSRKGSRST